MARAKIHVGLEIGTSKVCVLVGEVKVDGSIKILGLGTSKSVGVRKGEISDFVDIKACIRDALVKAEDTSDVEIGSVYLSISGGHVYGVNNTGTYRLPDNEKQIRREHLDEAIEIAKNVDISPEHEYLHHILRSYRVDGFEHTSSPVGLFGKTLEVDFHVISGIRTRMQNCIKCVREMHLDIDDIAFAPIATAQFAIDKNARERGALLIDIGGGTTDYALYLAGSLVASGCIPVGGEHITNDIHLITGLSFSKAEAIKIKEGDVSGEQSRSVGVIKIMDEKGFSQQEIKRETLNEVIRQRLLETLHLVYKRLPPGSIELIGTGVFLSGGTSSMRGLSELTHQIFGRDIYRAQAAEISGVQANFKDPQFATAIGLIRYAQLADIEKQNKPSGFFRRIWPFGKK